MENYKGIAHNPQTFEAVEIETKIPSDLVKQIKEKLETVDGYVVTPTMINPQQDSVVWGVMNKENRLKYRIMIVPNDQK